MSPRRLHLDTPFGPAEDTAPDEFADLPLERRQGVAFVALLEHIPTHDLPQHGGRKQLDKGLWSKILKDLRLNDLGLKENR